MARCVSHMGITLVRFPLAVVLLLCVLVAPVTALDIVLCIGADGHVTFEKARNGRCGTAGLQPSAATRLHTAVTLARADHCGPCVDIPMLTGDTRQQSLPVLPSPMQSAVPVLTLAPGVLPFSPELVTTPPLLALLLTPSPTLRALRTVVLLI
jgi:hypothetical protein